MKSILLCIVTAFSLAGCKSYVTHKYHLQRNFNFKSKSAYLHYLESKKIFDNTHILYADAEGYQKFIAEKLTQDSSIIYQGCYLNDSTCIKKSSTLSENTSCMGRIENDIQNIFKRTNFPDSIQMQVNKLSSYRFRKLHDNTVFQWNENKRISFFLAYSYSLGTYYDPLFKKIMSLCKQHESIADIYVITLDPLYLLQ